MRLQTLLELQQPAHAQEMNVIVHVLQVQRDFNALLEVGTLL